MKMVSRCVVVVMLVIMTLMLGSSYAKKVPGLTDQERLRGFLHKPEAVSQSFDCQARALAYVYAQQIQPGKNLSSVADALQLQSLCNYTVEDMTKEYSNKKNKKVHIPIRNDHDDNRIHADDAPSFYVDGNKGSDTNSGSISSPFKTILRALTASRAQQGPATIIIRAGTYYLTATIQLDSRDSGLTITSYPNEVVEINGGTPLQIGTWKPYNISSNVPRTYSNLNNVWGQVSNGGSTDTIKYLGKWNTTQQCQTACASYQSARCLSWTFHQPNLNNGYASECYGRTDDVWALTSQADVDSGRTETLNIYSTSLAGQNINEIRGLQINSLRATRARYPNANPELSVFPDGWWTLGNPAWAKPYPYAPSITNITTSPARTDTNEFQRFSVGYNGTCSIFTPPESYWCSSDRSGGGASLFMVPSGMTMTSAMMNDRLWMNAVGAVVHMWQVYHWELWMFEVDLYNATSFSSEVQLGWHKGGFQGARGLVDTSNPRGGEWYIENLLVLLDNPNEFFYDAPSSTLYYFPNGTSTTPPPPSSSATYVASNMAVLINITATQQEPVKDVTIQNLLFRNAAYTYMDPHGIPSGGDWALQRSAAVFVEGSINLVVCGCHFDRVDGNGLMLSGFNRNATLADNEFSWIGDSAMLAWGYTNGIDGTVGDQPRGTRVLRNIVREIGMFQKQSSAWFQGRSAQTLLQNNIFFNGPRAGINFNDGFGGGSEIDANLLFNQCRESSDHGPFNSWDRLPFWTDVPGEPSLVPLYNEIHHNFFICNYGSSMCIDNDDGSAYYKLHDNFEVYGGHKSDFGGHNKFTYNSVVAYAKDYGEGLCGDFNSVIPGFVDGYWNNTCVQGVDTPYFDVDGDPNNPQNNTIGVMHDNRVYNPSGKLQISVGGQTLNIADWQAKGFDKGTQGFPMPSDDQILAWGKAVLGM